MKSVTTRYYVAEGERAERVAQEGLQRANEYRRAGIELAKKYGFDGTMSRGSRPYAMVLFTEALDAEKPGFLAPKWHSDADGQMLIFRPNRRTSIGKGADIALQSLQAFDFSSFACDHFGVSWMSMDAVNHSLHHAVAGYQGGKLIFSIPFGGNGNNDADGPVIPPDLYEIKRSVVIAITEEGGE